uniref:DNA mismatch repair protein Mlh1 n=1 Tax=Crypthecodinium cohnii TaxID=2866 RepID=A0A516AGT3_CRYCO|nr:DNA mismatch repair protein Mlh1 [Crypthecodinium cohnii]
MEVRDGFVWSVPNALGLTSDAGLKFDELPIFLVRLCADVNWEEERQCFESLCRLVADFSVESILPDPEDVKQVMDSSIADAAEEAASLNAAVEAGEFEDIVAAAAAAKRKKQRTQGAEALQELRFIHEALRSDSAAAGLQSCRWPAKFRKDGTVIQLVALEQLYRIFERC